MKREWKILSSREQIENISRKEIIDKAGQVNVEGMCIVKDAVSYVADLILRTVESH
jgi:hypothetical protein